MSADQSTAESNVELHGVRKLQPLEREIGRRVGHLQIAGREGIGEALEAAQGQRRFAQRQCKRIVERAAVLRLYAMRRNV